MGAGESFVSHGHKQRRPALIHLPARARPRIAFHLRATAHACTGSGESTAPLAVAARLQTLGVLDALGAQVALLALLQGILELPLGEAGLVLAHLVPTKRSYNGGELAVVQPLGRTVEDVLDDRAACFG